MDSQQEVKRTPDARTAAGLAALRQRVVVEQRPATVAAASAAAPSTTAPAPATQPAVRRETNGELLQRARHGATARERDRAAETLRRQIKTLCAAVIDRHTSALTAQEAEDLTQEVFIRLLTSAAASERENQVLEPTPAYISRIAVNLLIDQRRFLDRRGLSTPGPSLDDAEAGVSIPDPREGVEEGVVGRFHRHQVREALRNALSPVEARVVWMRSDGASHAEIAAELGIKEPNARKHHERALKRLKKLAETGAFPVAA